MIAFEAVLREIKGIEAAELQHWIEARWVLPERMTEGYIFRDIDIARVHLIVELRQELSIDEEAMPVVLNLLDQVYALRHRLHALAVAIDALPADMQDLLRTHFKE
jgi:chaperone modulatory protein CbpM